jgi:hypothetical protein
MHACTRPRRAHAAPLRAHPSPATPQEAAVQQQLGPPPPAHAAAGLIVQYATMRKTRLRTLLVDYSCNLIESAVLFVVKLTVCVHLSSGAAGAGHVCWRLALLPLWWVGARRAGGGCSGAGAARQLRRG